MGLKIRKRANGKKHFISRSFRRNPIFCSLDIFPQFFMFWCGLANLLLFNFSGLFFFSSFYFALLSLKAKSMFFFVTFSFSSFSIFFSLCYAFVLFFSFFPIFAFSSLCLSRYNQRKATKVMGLCSQNKKKREKNMWKHKTTVSNNNNNSGKKKKKIAKWNVTILP